MLQEQSEQPNQILYENNAFFLRQKMCPLYSQFTEQLYKPTIHRDNINLIQTSSHLLK